MRLQLLSVFACLVFGRVLQPVQPIAPEATVRDIRNVWF